jgi:XTP/dITP diphosphohydrolase
MPLLKPGTRIVVASHNKGKIVEINDLVRPFGLEAVSAATLGLAEPDETEKSFAGNARLKAVAAMEASGLPALSDDSGLEVAALGGAPGIYSARWAGDGKDFGLAMRTVAEELSRRHVWPRPGSREPAPRANFICVLCLAVPGLEPQIFEGRVDGHLVWPTRGTKGFGYDPMFVADGQTLTFGEMEPAAKHAISHRARAFNLFVDACLAPKPAIEISEMVELVTTRADLARFIDALRSDLETNAQEWENTTLDRFLGAFGQWVVDSAHLPTDTSEPVWRTMARTLHAASLYE